MPTILGANSVSGYEIDNSLRFNDGDSPSLQFTPSSDSNEQTWTVSFWVKRGVMGTSSSQMIFASDTNYDEYVFCRFCGTEVTNKADMFQVFMVEPNAREGNVRTTRLFRDPSAWYHIVVRCDLTQSTAADRLRIYVNGVKETSFDTASYLNQNDDNINWNSNVPQAIGHQKQASSVERHLDGYLSDFHNIDGTSLGPDSFGKTNDNGVWVPIKYSGSYGTNGYKLEFKQTGTSANSSGMGADTSGNDHHWTPANLAAIDVTADTPTNNFATMNPVHKSSNGSAALPTFSEGNLKIAMGSDSSTSSTIAPSKGKWYVEYKQGENTADNGGYPIVGISATLGGTAGDVIGFRTPSGTDYRGQLGTTSVSNAFGSARSANDIFGFYINLDDDILIVHKNGSDYMSSGASSGLDWSGGLTTTNLQTGFYHFYVQNNQDGSPAFTDEVNFGNPSFSISSSNADANGYGSFEYSPTLSGTAFYAMCTKNLAEFG